MANCSALMGNANRAARNANHALHVALSRKAGPNTLGSAMAWRMFTGHLLGLARQTRGVVERFRRDVLGPSLEAQDLSRRRR